MRRATWSGLEGHWVHQPVRRLSAGAAPAVPASGAPAPSPPADAGDDPDAHR
ncbi:MAG: hypothetical protein SF182_06050 [Deltaproteobacteria bacterium]|nr:hypothetical protein [Deltaproteobacteria bacterium]